MNGDRGNIIIEIEGCFNIANCNHNPKVKREARFLESPSPSPRKTFINSVDRNVNVNGFFLKPNRESKPICIPKSDSAVLRPSPRFPTRSRKRAKSTNSRNLSVSPGTDLVGAFAGSLQESLLSGHMSTKSTIFSGYTARITASSPHLGASPAHLKIPFDAHYYHLEDYNRTPYAASIPLPKERFRIASSGSIQVTLFNPSGTPIKIFIVKYDLSTSLPANSKTFLRQITRTPTPPHILQYAIQFTIVCTKNKRFYIYNNVRVVFPHRVPDEPEKLEVLCQYPDKPTVY